MLGVPGDIPVTSASSIQRGDAESKDGGLTVNRYSYIHQNVKAEWCKDG